MDMELERVKNEHMMFWRLHWLIFYLERSIRFRFCLRWNVDMQPICLAEWRRALKVPNIRDVNVESGELVLLYNVPQVSFHNERFRLFSWLKQLLSALFLTYSTLPLSVRILFFSPFPTALKQANMPGLVLCYFALHQWCRKMTQDVTHRHQYSWPQKPCFTQYLCGLFSSPSLD